MEDNNVKEKKHFFHKKEKKAEVLKYQRKRRSMADRFSDCSYCNCIDRQRC